MGALGTLLGAADRLLREGQPRRLRPGRRHARRRRRERGRRLLRPDLPRVRLSRRLLDHGRPRTTSTATRRSPTPASARRPARATSPARPASRRSCPASATAIVRGGFLNDPIGLLKAVGETVDDEHPAQSSSPTSPTMATKIGRKQTYRAVISHPLVQPGIRPAGARSRCRTSRRIRALAAELFPPTGDAADRQIPRAGVERRSDTGRASATAPTPAEARRQADAEADAQADTAPKPSVETTPAPTPEPTPEPLPSTP